MYGRSSFITKDGILNLHLSSVQIWYFSFVAIGVLHLLIWYAVIPDQSWPGSWVSSALDQRVLGITFRGLGPAVTDESPWNN